ncbi:copper-binding protein [Acidovorax sp. Leaf160]|uniref:copper-binding protein n=1 Tax=Acidovorax sp. Leaf160 TaxID=1736280 RepID=UPI001F17C65C|nr:copper-binding protein [Acidovorax sp. Leaf160]
MVRWDAAAKRLTLRHGELKRLGMAAMTMVFRVPDSTAGLQLSPGTRVRFLAEQDRSGLVARRIEVVKP